ncbi:Thaumatin family [Dillenia turbinata]|uniref:Thaumatin family n=1 Tax=Dillenia turbinata TaxID=194707 RepID=A0AAN8Z2X4_9MAGN
MGTLSSHTSTTTILSLLLFILCKGVSSTTFTFVNKCDFIVWPGILSSAGSPKLDSTGFELPKGTSRSFQAPSGWSGRFWGRTGCNFDSSGKGSCSTGDCGSGQIECNGAGANPPATLAEFTLGSGSSRDFYDVSLVDGYNLPMFVEGGGESGACETTGCYADLNLRCPAELKTEGGGACKSACDAFGSPEYCCSGAYNTAATCKPSVYSQIFKSACPKSYSYAYDDATSTFTCIGADYTVTFCPTPSVTSRQTAPKTTGTEGSGSDSGSVEAAMLANGSWLANLATADSTRPQPSLVHQFAFMAVTLFSLIFSFSHL